MTGRFKSNRVERRRSPSPQKRREEPVRRRKPDYDAKFDYSYTFSDTAEESEADELLYKREERNDHRAHESNNKKTY